MRKNKRPNEAEQAAGNGILDRRLFLTAGAGAIGSAVLSDKTSAAEALAVEPWMKTPGSPFTATGSLRSSKQGRADFCKRAGHDRHRRLAHAAASAQRHDHAERASFRAPSHRHSRHRSGRASAADPRPRQTPAGLHAGGADALSDGVAHRLHRMRRQRPRALPEGAGTGSTSRRSTAWCPAPNGPA